MTNLKVKQENIDSEVSYNLNGSSYHVVLKDATQEQLRILKDEIGLDELFEASEKQAKPEKAEK